jgi:HEAT repeat protein
MLDDTDGQVQREALRAIVQIGTNEAYQVLEQALNSGMERTREAILLAIGNFRDEKAAPLFVFMLNNTSHTGQMEAIYTQTIDSLGKVATDERSVSTLKDILHRGEWWAWGRTARIRLAAARALRTIGTVSADRALEEAVASGSMGVRKAARVALAEPAPPRARRTAP